MRWSGHKERIENMRNTYKLFVGKHEGRGNLRDLGIDGRILFK
jgi:hypothetical protein